LVSGAEAAGDTLVVIDIDPNEGSGVIPTDWKAFLQPRGTTKPEASARGQENPDLRKLRGLQTVKQRNYDCDRFWMVFSLVSESGEPLFPPGTTEAELVVRIYNREGTVRWNIPASVLRRASDLAYMRNRQAAKDKAATN
jgi:hypothetical protein